MSNKIAVAILIFILALSKSTLAGPLNPSDRACGIGYIKEIKLFNQGGNGEDHRTIKVRIDQGQFDPPYFSANSTNYWLSPQNTYFINIKYSNSQNSLEGKKYSAAFGAMYSTLLQAMMSESVVRIYAIREQSCQLPFYRVGVKVCSNGEDCNG